MPIILNIDLQKIPDEAVRRARNGDWCDLILWPNRDGEERYGFHGCIRLSLSKEDRAAGKKAQIVGNYKDTDLARREPDRPRGQYQQRKERAPYIPRPATEDAPGDDVPF